MPVEGFKGHVATDGMYGSMEAEYEVQRSIKSAELTAFSCLLRKVIGPIKVHVSIEGTFDGLQKGEKRVYQAKSRRCKPVDQNQRRIA